MTKQACPKKTFKKNCKQIADTLFRKQIMTSLAEIISRNERMGGRSGGWDEQMDGRED